MKLECGCDLVLSVLPSRTVTEYNFFNLTKFCTVKEYYCPNHYRYVRRKTTLLEGYIAAWKKYSTDEVKIRVARPSILAPSKDLLREFMAAKREFMKKQGLSEHEARQAAVGSMNFEQRFRDQILKDPKALQRLQEIKKFAKTHDVRLLCYEKEPPCHRFILIQMIKELK